MKRVMIDLETMGVHKDAAIIQIGAAVFKPVTPEYVRNDYIECVHSKFCINVSLQSCHEAGLSSDYQTEEWWKKPENEEALRKTQETALAIRDALIELRCWALMDTDVEDIEMWANGTSFDLAILETAYRSVGIPMPWKYWNERDYRTMKSLWRSVEKPPFVGTRHNAVDDAVNQAVHLVAIMHHIDRMAQNERNIREAIERQHRDLGIKYAPNDDPNRPGQAAPVGKVEAPLEYGCGVIGE